MEKRVDLVSFARQGRSDWKHAGGQAWDLKESQEVGEKVLKDADHM